MAGKKLNFRYRRAIESSLPTLPEDHLNVEAREATGINQMSLFEKFKPFEMRKTWEPN